MKYIIMADGKGTRWQNADGVPKHLVKINGETLLERITALVRKYDKNAEVIITTHNSEYETQGATLYVPQNNVLEIDRFTRELISDDICFLYGDTYYSEDAISKIVDEKVDDILFFGAGHSIVGIKIKDGELFKYHFERVRSLYLEGKINQCIGWQVYLSFIDKPLDQKQFAQKMVRFNDSTRNFNTPEDLQKLREQVSLSS